MDDYPLLDIFFTMMWFYLIIAWFWFLITLMSDVFRSRDLSGLAKGLWIVFLILLPFIAAVCYLIARGGSMHERQAEQVARMRGAEGAPPQSPANEIAQLAALRDSGALTDAEFQAQKSRVLAS